MKGISLTLEAFIAIIFLLFALFFFIRPVDVPEFSEARHKALVYNILKILDETGKLRKYALDNNSTSIKEELTKYIPYLSYDVVIYNKTSNLTAIPSVENKNVISVSYFLAGDVGNYSVREVKVFVWGFD